MAEEIAKWLPIPGTNERYFASADGRVKSYVLSDGGIIMHPKDRLGYDCIKIKIDGADRYIDVHRIIAKLFIPNPENKPYVNHIDGNKKNNRADNLEWCTAKENSIHSVRVLKKSGGDGYSKKVRCIETGEIFSSMGKAEKKYGIFDGGIGRSIRKNFSTSGLHWEIVI